MSGSEISNFKEQGLQTTDLKDTWITNASPEDLTATPDGRGYTLALLFGEYVTHPQAKLGAPRGTQSYFPLRNLRSSDKDTDELHQGCTSEQLAAYGYVGIYKLA